MPKPKTKEKSVLMLLDGNDLAAVHAFDRMVEHFSDCDALEHTDYMHVVKIIYVERSTEPFWAIANRIHISERTLSRYRDDILKWFRYYYEKERSALSA